MSADPHPTRQSPLPSSLPSPLRKGTNSHSESQGVPKDQCCHQQDEGHTKVINAKMPRQPGPRQRVRGTAIPATRFSRLGLGVSLPELALNRLGKQPRFTYASIKGNQEGHWIRNQRDRGVSGSPSTRMWGVDVCGWARGGKMSSAGYFRGCPKWGESDVALPARLRGSEDELSSWSPCWPAEMLSFTVPTAASSLVPLKAGCGAAACHITRTLSGPETGQLPAHLPSMSRLQSPVCWDPPGLSCSRTCCRSQPARPPPQLSRDLA